RERRRVDDAVTMPMLRVHAFWDADAGVFVATSDDVPGLVTEAETFEALCAKLRVMIPELLEDNGIAGSGADVPFTVLAERLEHARGADG
ncbi:MAG: DUF1902 domain-containing protein, partial [Gemmataceae bacterium]